MKGLKCECGPANFVWLVVACAVLGAGAMLFVHSLLSQWAAGGMNPQIWLWYTGSLVVLSVGCCLKRKACAGCPLHQ